MKEITKKYSNGELTIVWKPATCIHSTICWKAATGLPHVFRPLDKPWIRPERADSAQLVEQVQKCPSGALSFYWNEDAPGSDNGASGSNEDAPGSDNGASGSNEDAPGPAAEDAQ